MTGLRLLLHTPVAYFESFLGETVSFCDGKAHSTVSLAYRYLDNG